MQNIPRPLNRVTLSANSFCRAPQTLCHFSISWRCHGIPYHLLSLPLPSLHSLAMRNNQRNLVMSCVTLQNKSISDSCRRALQNCMAEIKIKIYREKCKTCPTRCPRPCCPTPPSTPSLPVKSDRSCGAKCKLRQSFFSLSLHLLFAAKL